MSSFIDKNYRSLTVSDTTDLVPELLDADASYNDTLKLSSKASNITVADKTIVNRNEDCVDLCRVFNSLLLRLTLRPQGQNGITVKGASTGNKFTQLRFESHGSRCDIELGQFDNYWYPGRLPTDLNDFSGKDANDAFPDDAVTADIPVKIFLWDAGEHNTFNFKFQKITRIPKFIWFPYFLFRYVSIRVENVVRKFKKQTPILTS